jgi:hypothetical protein
MAAFQHKRHETAAHELNPENSLQGTLLYTTSTAYELGTWNMKQSNRLSDAVNFNGHSSLVW